MHGKEAIDELIGKVLIEHDYDIDSLICANVIDPCIFAQSVCSDYLKSHGITEEKYYKACEKITNFKQFCLDNDMEFSVQLMHEYDPTEQFLCNATLGNLFEKEFTEMSEPMDKNDPEYCQAVFNMISGPDYYILRTNVRHLADPDLIMNLDAEGITENGSVIDTDIILKSYNVDSHVKLSPKEFVLQDIGIHLKEPKGVLNAHTQSGKNMCMEMRITDHGVLVPSTAKVELFRSDNCNEPLLANLNHIYRSGHVVDSKQELFCPDHCNIPNVNKKLGTQRSFQILNHCDMSKVAANTYLFSTSDANIFQVRNNNYGLIDISNKSTVEGKIYSHVQGKAMHEKITVILDSGCSRNILSEDYFDQHSDLFRDNPVYDLDDIHIRVANDELIKVRKAIKFTIEIDHHYFELICYIAKVTKSFSLALSAQYMKDLSVKLDFGILTMAFRMDSLPLLANRKYIVKPGENMILKYGLKNMQQKELLNELIVAKCVTRRFDLLMKSTTVWVINNKFKIELQNNTSSNIIIEAGDLMMVLDMRSKVQLYSNDNLPDKPLKLRKVRETENTCLTSVLPVNCGPNNLPKHGLYPTQSYSKRYPLPENDDLYPWLEKNDPLRHKTDEQLIIENLNFAGSVFNEQEQKEATEMIKSHRPSLSLRKEIGKCEQFEVYLTLNNYDPWCIAAYNLPESQKEYVTKNLEKYVALGILSEGLSAYQSPMFLLQKKNKEPRLISDFRVLNSKLIDIQCSIPTLRQIFSSIGYAVPVPHEMDKVEGTAYVNPYDLLRKDIKQCDQEQQNGQHIENTSHGEQNKNFEESLAKHEVQNVEKEKQKAFDITLPSEIPLTREYKIRLLDSKLDPQARELLDSQLIFSLIDLKQAYHCLRLSEDSKVLTGIRAFPGSPLFLYNCLGQGLKVAPSVFCYFQNLVLDEMPRKGNVLNILDDNLCYSTKKDHLSLLSQLFDLLEHYGLKVNLSKLQLGRTEVVFYGLMLRSTPKGIQAIVLKERTEAIRKLQRPKTVKEVKQLCGLLIFIANWLPHLQTDLIPLYNLTRKNTPFVWSNECQDAFNKIKAKLISPDVLYLPARQGKYKIYVDASRESMGSLLLQKVDNDEKLHIIGYASKKLPLCTSTYSISEIEMLCVYLAIKSYSHLLSTVHFECYTDHAALKNIVTAKTQPPTKRIAKLVELLSDYSFTLSYVKPTSSPYLSMADYISRHHGEDILDKLGMEKVTPICFGTEDLNVMTRSQTKINVGQMDSKTDMIQNENLNSKQDRIEQVDTQVKDPIELLEPGLDVNDPLFDQNLPGDASLYPGQNVLTGHINPEANRDLKLDTSLKPSRDPSEYVVKPLQFSGNLDIAHRLPKQSQLNKLIDSLNKKVLHDVHLPIEMVDLKNSYSKSPYFSAIYRYLRTGHCSLRGKPRKYFKIECENYVIIEGLLFKLVYRKQSSEPKLLLCITEIYTYDILYITHKQLAHSGTLKCYLYIREFYYIPKLFDNIRRFILACTTCMMVTPRKKSQQTSIDQLRLIPDDCKPMHICSIDIKQLPKSEAGYSYVLMLVCNMTYYMVTIALKDITSKTIYQALLTRVWSIFGTCKTLIMDMQTSFKSSLMLSLYHIFKIQPVYISVLNHRSLISESGISTLMHLFKKHLVGSENDWENLISSLTYAYNCTVHTRLGYSPYEMVFLRPPRSHMSIDFDPEIPRKRLPKEYMSFMTRRAEILHEFLKDRRNLMKETEYVKAQRQYPEAHGFNKYDLVFLHSPHLSDLKFASRKLNCKVYVGPFLIISSLDPQSFILASFLHRLEILPIVVHKNRLKRFYIQTGTLDKNHYLTTLDNVVDLFKYYHHFECPDLDQKIAQELKAWQRIINPLNERADQPLVNLV